MTDDDVRQIWAEAKHYFQAGESLCLPPNLQEEACSHQRQELETDELEGVILDYLDPPIPLEWSQMDLSQRLNFLQNENSGPGTQRKGTERRTEISPIEIWCECFKKNKADYNGKTDGRRIITVPAQEQLDTWEETARTFLRPSERIQAQRLTTTADGRERSTVSPFHPWEASFWGIFTS